MPTKVPSRRLRSAVGTSAAGHTIPPKSGAQDTGNRAVYRLVQLYARVSE